MKGACKHTLETKSSILNVTLSTEKALYFSTTVDGASGYILVLIGLKIVGISMKAIVEKRNVGS